MKDIAKLLALVAAMTAVPLAAQSSDSNDVRGAVDAVRDRGRSIRVIELLSKERGNLSPSELDALADDLVSLAVAFDATGSPKEHSAATAALAALLSSADAGRTTPYPRAFDSIQRVYEGSREPGIRGATLYAMTQLNGGRAVGFLTGVATSNDLEASFAVKHLGFDLGAPGVAALKRLYKAGTVVQYSAQQALEAIAASKGW